MDLTYWTEFVFKEPEPGATSFVDIPDLHCTHKYLGKQGQENRDRIIDLIRLYFKWTARPLPGIWCFDRLDFFDEGSIVLCTNSLNNFMGDLREELGLFALDVYPTYRPHVTIAHSDMRPKNLPLLVPLYLEPIEYRLMGKGVVIGKWSL